MLQASCSGLWRPCGEHRTVRQNSRPSSSPPSNLRHIQVNQEHRWRLRPDEVHTTKAAKEKRLQVTLACIETIGSGWRIQVKKMQCTHSRESRKAEADKCKTAACRSSRATSRYARGIVWKPDSQNLIHETYGCAALRISEPAWQGLLPPDKGRRLQRRHRLCGLFGRLLQTVYCRSTPSGERHLMETIVEVDLNQTEASKGWRPSQSKSAPGRLFEIPPFDHG